MNNILYTVWLSHDIICYHMMSYLQKASVISWRGNQLDSLASNILQNVFNPPCFWSFCYALLLNLCDAKPHTNIQKLDWAHTCHMLVPPHTACSTSRAATALPALVLASVNLFHHSNRKHPKTWWRRLWSDRALSCFSEVVLEVQSTIPCKTQDFIHEPCSIDVKKWFKNIGGVPQN